MKTILKIFICISLIYTPFFAFAGAAEKWEILENVYDTSKNVVNVTAKKVNQAAANSGVYKVQVPVSASALGKTVKSMMWTGIAVAGVQAMLEGIGWIIDTGSKTIKKPIETEDIKPKPNNSFCGTYSGTTVCDYDHVSAANKYANTYVTLANQQIDPNHDPDANVIRSAKVINQQSPYLDGSGYYFSFFTLDITYKDGSKATNQDYVISPVYPTIKPPPGEYEYISDSELGNEILGNGENKSPLPDVIEDAYDPNNPVSDEPAPQATNDALDSANPQPGTESDGSTTPKPNSDTNGDGVPDTYDPAKPDQGSTFKLPPFCEYAPAVCDFFKVQKQDNKEIKENQKTDLAQNKTFFDEVKDWFTWSKENDDLPADEKLQITEIPTPELKEDAIRWSAQCPSDVQIPITMQGISSTITFSWSPWCQLLSMIKPAIIASAYIGAAFIVLGLRT